jgi:hypothetical protein
MSERIFDPVTTMLALLISTYSSATLKSCATAALALNARRNGKTFRMLPPELIGTPGSVEP